MSLVIPVYITICVLLLANLAEGCKCSNESLCHPLPTKVKTEVFAFVFGKELVKSEWELFDWSKLTTLVLVGEKYLSRNIELICHAHGKGVKVSVIGNYPKEKLGSRDYRSEWIRLRLEKAQEFALDGINIDVEFEVAEGSQDAKDLTELVRETAQAYHKAIPHSQVTFDVAWSPDGIDGRFYDAVGLSEASDFLFVMSYDEQSQIFSKDCTARPNSGLVQTTEGVKKYLNLGIPSSKLVLGVPWYGYNYTCINVTDGICFIGKKPFRGVECSDAVGTQHPYSTIMKILKDNERLWDHSSKTPYFFFNNSGVISQFRYDDPESLSYKYSMARKLELRGVGMWNAVYLDYSRSPGGKKQRSEMWGAMPQNYGYTLQPDSGSGASAVRLSRWGLSSFILTSFGLTGYYLLAFWR